MTNLPWNSRKAFIHSQGSVIMRDPISITAKGCLTSSLKYLLKVNGPFNDAILF